jgi:hypothetical protein
MATTREEFMNKQTPETGQDGDGASLVECDKCARSFLAESMIRCAFCDSLLCEDEDAWWCKWCKTWSCDDCTMSEEERDIKLN